MKISLFTLVAVLLATDASIAIPVTQEKFQTLKLGLILRTRNFTTSPTFGCGNQNARSIQQRVLTAVARAKTASFNESVRSGKSGSTDMVSSVQMVGMDDSGANYSVTLEMPRVKLTALAQPELTSIQLEMKDIGIVVCSK